MHSQPSDDDVAAGPLSGGRRRTFPFWLLLGCSLMGFLWGMLAGLCVGAILLSTT